MKLTWVFFIISFSVFITTSETKKDYIKAFVIKLAIETLLTQIKKAGHIVLLKDFSLNIPSALSNTIVMHAVVEDDHLEKKWSLYSCRDTILLLYKHYIRVGHIGLKNLTLYGFSTLNYTDIVNVDKEYEDNIVVNTYNVNINATLNKLGLHMIYELDLGVAGSLPLYGKGEIQFEVKDVDIKENITVIGPNGFKIQELELQLSLRTSRECYITGFWNNIRVSRFLTKALKLIGQLFVMFYSYNKRCLDCIISRILQVLFNLFLTGRKDKYQRCYCSEDSILIDEIQNFWETWECWTVKKMAETVEEEFGDPERLRKIIKILKNLLDTILKYRYNLQKLLQ